MDASRRWFVKNGLTGGALAVGTGGFLFFRRSKLRAAVVSKMLDAALPPLTANAARTLSSLPGRAREEIKRYFHGKCLNVEGFVSYICSSEFIERLSRLRTQEEKEQCLLLAFCSRVASEAEILNWVETIAAEIGAELDVEWMNYCTELSLKWNACIREYGAPLMDNELTKRLNELIQREIGQAAQLVLSADQRPAIGDTIKEIGKSAILLLPLMRLGQFGKAVGIPIFFVLAARSIWDFVMSRLVDRRGEYQTAISSRLALLGNRVGAEFEREIRQRITDLHIWQDRSIRGIANRLAEERVGLL